ncbi:hypothetical protein [Leuconostoc sp.]|uniref:hypothetical protein n=1 Tax=Leuconostoc sp. TaxID=1930076 RepID=UPI00257E7054|nr:hypothetical protein [Leuconostoc sp.]NLT85119.1 hypothetical protein [Leuconostoc sp.]
MKFSNDRQLFFVDDNEDEDGSTITTIWEADSDGEPLDVLEIKTDLQNYGDNEIYMLEKYNAKPTMEV